MAWGPSLLRPGLAGRAVLAYGDSLTAGYASGGMVMAPYAPVLERKLGDARVDHCGHPGMTAREMVAYADEPGVGLRAILRAAPYDLTVLMAGTNDFAEVPRGRPASQIDLAAESLRVAEVIFSLHEIAHSEGCRTLALGVPGSQGQREYPFFRALADAVNAELRRRCEACPRASFVPCPVAYERGPLWEADGLHFSPAGSEALGEALEAPVRDLLT
mmetsp:Transcript_4167/g.12278  ORF Transcript_4167/g.12278 Transcript_4167/m.12278 type:complete len:217 (-) Transcript_4167:22-672(-)